MDEFSSNGELGNLFSKLNKKQKIALYLFSGILFSTFFYSFLLSAPRNFPKEAIIRIEPGMSLRNVSYVLEKQHIIRSRVAFESFAIIFGSELHIQSADYFFEKKIPVWQVAGRIERGEHKMAPVVVTVPEGIDTNQVGDIFVPRLVYFDKTRFLLKAKNLEGYLFPDTYFFLTSADEENVLQSMEDNFNKKIISLRPAISASQKTEKDIIIMASIIEKEAKGDADREVISGILWKRISIGIPLQVDAVPITYKIKGLPKSPIGNPGLEAIKAAIYPQNSPYLYYLHDKDGLIHYAKSFSEHSKNIVKYLR